MNRSHLKNSFLCLAALGTGLFTAPAQAQGTLYGVTYLSNQLIRVDATTGDGALIAPLAAPGTPEGLAFSGGSLYYFDTTGNALRQINPATGATLSTVNVGIANRVGEGGMAFGANGAAYLYTPLEAATFAPVNELYSFNPTTGAASLIGSTGVALEALTFSGGVLYGLGKADGNLYTVNPATASASLIGSVGIGVGSPVGALAAGPNGSLFASLDDALYTLNPATGVATLVDPLGSGAGIGFSSVSGLAFAPSAVPEPGAFGLLAGVVTCGGALTLRRKRRV